MVPPGLTHPWVTMQVFNIFNALGTIAFAYGGHNVVGYADASPAFWLTICQCCGPTVHSLEHLEKIHPSFPLAEKCVRC